jgi:hypothetical protein
MTSERQESIQECEKLRNEMPEAPNAITLVVFFLGVALCMWRLPRADRSHVVLCSIAGLLWCKLPLFDPSTRSLGYPFVVATFLGIGLSQRFRKEA